MKRPITFIVVDDDQKCIDHIVQLVRPFRNWMLIKSFTDPVKALDYLAGHHVDFVLLDVEMPHIGGHAFMLQMPPEIHVILYTAHREYASDGFDYGVVDFLNKPVSLERLNTAMGRMAEKLNIKTVVQGDVKGDYYYFMMKGPAKGTRTLIYLDEIVYIESLNDNTYFYLVGEMEPDGMGEEPLKWDDPKKPLGTLCKDRLHELRKILKGTSLMKIHRSIILNTSYFGTYEKQTVKLRGFNTILPVGKPKNYPDFYAWMDGHNLPGL